METTLHRQLKTFYATPGAQFEQRVGRYRIDVVRGEELVEIQLASLSAIRDKVAALTEEHPVRVVKPIIARKTLIKRRARGGKVVSRRLSPKRGTLYNIFDELVHFTRVFPRPNLTLDVLLVEIEEWRYPGHGRRRRWRATDHVVEDQRLTEVVATHVFRTAADLGRLVPDGVPRPFHTAHLAEHLEVERWVAQRIAFCLRKCGEIEPVGKLRGAWLYERPAKKSRRRAA